MSNSMLNHFCSTTGKLVLEWSEDAGGTFCPQCLRHTKDEKFGTFHQTFLGLDSLVGIVYLAPYLTLGSPSNPPYETLKVSYIRGMWQITGYNLLLAGPEAMNSFIGKRTCITSAPVKSLIGISMATAAFIRVAERLIVVFESSPNSTFTFKVVRDAETGTALTFDLYIKNQSGETVKSYSSTTEAHGAHAADLFISALEGNPSENN